MWFNTVYQRRSRSVDSLLAMELEVCVKIPYHAISRAISVEIKDNIRYPTTFLVWRAQSPVKGHSVTALEKRNL
jgi:hypothetical protein